MDIVVKEGRIAAIRAASKALTPSSQYTVVNLSGRSVLPGLISDHSHLGQTDGKNAGGQYTTTANILRQLQQYEAYGITTVVSLGLNQQSFYDLAPKIHAGELPGADMFGADRGFGVPDGAPPTALGITEEQVYRPRTIEEARAEVRETASRHPTFVKIWVDDFHGQMPQKLSPPIYKAIIDEAHAQGLRVAAHVYYLADAKQLVANGVDVLAHGVRDVPVDHEFIAAVKAHHVWYIPTLGLDESSYLFADNPALTLPIRFWCMPYNRLADKGSLSMNEQNVKTLYDAGVHIGFGVDSGATPLRMAGFPEHRELELLVAAGLTPLQALGTATQSAAALLKLDDSGVLAPGKLADLLVVEGDPSRQITDSNRIVSVWRRGKQVAASLDGPSSH